MILPIVWGDLKRILPQSKFTNEQENQSPPFYFEDEVNIIIYLETRKGNIWCSIIKKESLENVVDFKRAEIPEAIELTEQLKNDITFEINQK